MGQRELNRAVEEFNEYYFTKVFLASKSERDVITAELRKTIESIEISADPMRALCEQIVLRANLYGDFEVISLDRDLKTRNLLHNTPFISGDLHRHIRECAAHVGALKELVAEPDATDEVLYEVTKMHAARFMHSLQVFRLMFVAGAGAEPDWFAPVIISSLIWAEHKYRTRLGLASLLVRPQDIELHKRLFELVREATPNPMSLWQKESECQYKILAGLGAVSEQAKEKTPVVEATPDRRETVVVVHGTFAAPTRLNKPFRKTKWFEPEGSFCAALDQCLERLGSNARCWQHLEKGSRVPFSWSGANDWEARREAATSLRGYLELLNRKGWTVHVVAHSHGGNVLLEALGIDSVRAPEWFSGKVVLMGTPVLERSASSVRLPLTSACFSAVLVAVLVGLLAFILWQTGAGLFGTPWNVPAVILVTVLIGMFCLYMSDDLGNLFGTMSNTVLCLNNKSDEAFLILRKIKHQQNPLLVDRIDRDAIVSIAPTGRKSWWAMLADVHGSVREYIRLADRRGFPAVEAPLYFPSVILFILCAVSVTLILMLGVESVLLLDVLIVSVIIILWIFLIKPKVIVAAGFVPVRWIMGLVEYWWRMGLGVAISLSDRWAKIRAWRMFQDFGFGFSGLPYGMEDHDVEMLSSMSPWCGFTYLEIPDAVASSTSALRGEFFRGQVDRILKGALDSAPASPFIGPELFALGDAPLVHNSYYAHPACIRKVAEWLSAPLRTSIAEPNIVIVKDGDVLMKSPPGFRYSEENFDPRFDDPILAWSD